MTDELRDAADWADAMEIDPADIAFEGEPAEALDHVEARIDELETALEDLDGRDPQRGPVNLELGALRAMRAALRERVDTDQEGES
jgi:hypothetical protein